MAESVRDEIKQHLNQMSFEDIQKLQNKLGLKKFNEVMGQSDEKKDNNDKAGVEEKMIMKRLNKNRPQEISSKKRVPILRNVFQTKKPSEHIDPRFNSAMGEYKPELFRKQYSFINDIRKNEIQELTDQLRNGTENDGEKKAQLKAAITRLKQQVKSFEESEKQEDMKKKFKDLARQDAKEGEKPLFINKSEQRILELAEKYKELKKSGKVENFLAKKRKKQLSKDNKHLNKNQHMRFV